MRPAWVPLPDGPQMRDCPKCGGLLWRDHWDTWTCARCDREIRMASENASLLIQRTYVGEDVIPEGTTMKGKHQ